MDRCTDNAIKAELLDLALAEPDGDNAPRPTGRVAEHLQTCESCQALWASTVIFIDAESGLDPDVPHPSPPPSPDRAATKHLPEPIRQDTRRRQMMWGAALVAVATLVTLMWLWSSGHQAPAPSPVVALDAGREKVAEIDSDAGKPEEAPRPALGPPDATSAIEESPAPLDINLVFGPTASGAQKRTQMQLAQGMLKLMRLFESQDGRPLRVWRHPSGERTADIQRATAKELLADNARGKHIDHKTIAALSNAVSADGWLVYVGTGDAQPTPSIGTSEGMRPESGLVKALRERDKVKLIMTRPARGPWLSFCNQHKAKCLRSGASLEDIYRAHVWFATEVLGLDASTVPRPPPPSDKLK